MRQDLDSYWTRLLSRRASRRTVLGGAALAGSAALLAACSDNSPSGGSAAASKVFSDTREEGPVRKGGTWKAALSADLPSLDPYQQSTANVSSTIGTFAANRLMHWKSGPGIDPFSYTLAPDLAASHEISDGGLTYTFKLRQGVKFHDKQPVNGRLLSSQDVVASYKRFSAEAPQFGNSFAGVVAGVTAPDNSTVVFRLTKPNAAFLNIIATHLFLWVFPREAGIDYDPLETVIGTGPFSFESYVPAVRYEFKKNPDYYEPGLPNMDAATFSIIREAMDERAQFQAGSILLYAPGNFGDFEAMTTALPDARIYSNGFGGSQGVGFNRDNPESPFLKDVRVRQAFSLALDRDLLLQSFNNIDAYNSYGVKRDYRLTNFVQPNLHQWWVDPRGAEMGDSAQWYMYDAKKAKQLMVAAGYPNGFDTVQHHSINNTNDRYLGCQPLFNQWLAEIGIRGRLSAEDYASVFNPQSWSGHGDGWVNWGWQSFGDPGQQLQYLFGPDSTRNQMGVNDPTFNAMYAQQQAELDPQKRRSQLIDVYKHLQHENRHIGWSYSCVDSYTLYQPQVKNLGAYRYPEPGGQRILRWYLDA